MPVTLTPTTTLPRTRATLTSVGILHAWHLLSLDAPTVAVLWTAFFARAAHLELPVSELLAMFLAVWLLYVADRLLDANAQPKVRVSQVSRLRPGSANAAQGAPQHLMPRHLFHRRHRRAFLAAALFVTIVLVPLTLHLPARDLHLDLALAGVLAAWFALIHVVAPARTLPKELTTGIFFAAATILPAYTRHPGASLIPQAILFAALATLNGLYITYWEGVSSSLFRRGSRALGLAVLAGSAACGFLLRSPAPLAIALAAAALLLVDRARTSLSPTTLRAAADLALLTPILVWPFLR